MPLTLRLYVVYGSQNKQRLLPYKTLTYWFCITEMESVYSTVSNEPLYKTDMYAFKRLILSTQLFFSFKCVGFVRISPSSFGVHSLFSHPNCKYL
jgi:hypothetical protein